MKKHKTGQITNRAWPQFWKGIQYYIINKKYICKGYIQNVNTGYLWIVR